MIKYSMHYNRNFYVTLNHNNKLFLLSLSSNIQTFMKLISVFRPKNLLCREINSSALFTQQTFNGSVFTDVTKVESF
jgi:hypothetical protein